MAISLISSLPIFISPEEHKTASASTPASFADIPPVLHHKQENVSVTLDPPLDGFTPEHAANGVLYVIESALVFMSAMEGNGFQIDYPTITLHAISRTESGPSMYCQLGDPSTAEAAEGDDDASDMRELVIIPKDASSLESIFESLSLCAALHPDPADEDDMDDDDNAFVDPGEFQVFSGDADQELSEVGKAALAHLESIIYDPFETSTEQFEDALEGEQTTEEGEKGVKETDTTERTEIDSLTANANGKSE